jgi:hypothetical protein
MGKLVPAARGGAVYPATDFCPIRPESMDFS